MTSLGTERLTSLFPFQIVADFDLAITSVGPSLGKICPSIKIGETLGQSIRFVRPSIPLQLEALKRRAGALVLVESLAEKVALRGQYVVDEAEKVILFAIAPRILEMSELETLKLSVNDFARSDPVLDFLIALQTKDTLLNDAMHLNDELKERHKQLEQAREELLLLVEEKQRAKDALRSAHEDLAARLETITQQQREIARISVPRIDVWQGVAALPAVGTLNEERLERLREAVTETAARDDIETVIVDLTGIEVLDESVPQRLVELARIANLLGRRCYFSGINANLARGFVETGLDLKGLEFLPNVRAAIAQAVTKQRTSNSRS